MLFIFGKYLTPVDSNAPLINGIKTISLLPWGLPLFTIKRKHRKSLRKIRRMKFQEFLQ